MENRTEIYKPRARCFNCQTYGHVARDCPQPRKPMKCLNCAMEGHIKKYCRQVKTEQTVSFIDVVSSKSKYIKPVGTNEHTEKVFGLIDTGCL